MRAVQSDRGSVRPDLAAAYTDLRRAVVEAGLLERAYGYYAVRMVVYLALFALALAIPFLRANSLPWLACAAVLLGVANVQLGLIGHDAGHLAVFRGSRSNRALGSLCWSLLLGVGFWWWSDRHNRHHSHTNDTQADPEMIGGGLIAFTDADARSRTRRGRWIVRHQAYFPQSIILMSLMVTFAFRIESVVFAIRRLRGRRRFVELMLIATNLIAYALPLPLIGWSWVAVYVASQMVSGLCLAMIVAPNHKGMPVWAQGTRLSFVEQQVLSSRDIESHPITDWFFGGLNYQIEHHLFPNMARVKLKPTHALVKRFCSANGLDFDVVDPLTSYRAVLDELRRVGRAAHDPVTTPTPVGATPGPTIRTSA